MSTTELVILSSSPITRCNYIFSPPRSAQVQTPARTPAQSTFSTSPDLPTLSNLLATKDGNSLCLKPQVTVQHDPSRLPLAGVGPKDEVVGGKLKRVRKKKTTTVEGDECGPGKGNVLATGSENPVKKAPRQRKKKTAEQGGENDEVSRYFAQNERDENTVVADVPIKKTRKKREVVPKAKKAKDASKKGDSQAKMTKARSSKSLASTKDLLKDAHSASDEKKEMQGLSVDNETLFNSVKAQNPIPNEKHLDDPEEELNFAIPRRKDWTPPKYSDALPPSNQAELLREGQEMLEMTTSEPSIFKFLPEYRFDSEAIGQKAVSGPANAGSEAPTKKRRLEVRFTYRDFTRRVSLMLLLEDLPAPRFRPNGKCTAHSEASTREKGNAEEESQDYHRACYGSISLT